MRHNASYSPALFGAKRGGFTLLELLAATAMFAVLIGAVYSVFYGAIKLRETAYDAFQRTLPRSYVIGIIRNDLANIVPPAGLLAAETIGEKRESGSVRSDVVEMHTASGTVTEGEVWGEIQRVEYYLTDPENPEDLNNADSRDLVRAVTRNLLASTEEAPEEARLLRNVLSLELSYYDGETWLDSWDSTQLGNALPDAISVRIDFVPAQAGERRHLPIELMVPVVSRAVVLETTDETGTGGDTGGPSGSGGGGAGGGPGQGGGPGGGGR